MKYVAAIAFFLLCGCWTHAQTCTGGLGDPIVKFTFGSGPNFGPPLAPGITNMTYIADQCPEDGYYSIVSSVTNCYSGAWFNVLSDHTGDPNGRFMLINASIQPSDFYVQQVDNLCAGTTYQFAAWALNMVDKVGEILPAIQFQIEDVNGKILGKASGSLPVTIVPQWTQYGLFFTTPPGVTSVVIRMTNNAGGGIGNDLAIDDITFRPAGPSMQLQVAAFPSDTVALCSYDLSSLTFNSVVGSCYTNTSYQWQQSLDQGQTWTDIPGATGPSYTRTATGIGIYLYRLRVAEGSNINIITCSAASNPIRVNVVPIPVPGVSIAPTAAQICANTPDTFNAVPVNGGFDPAYQWMVNGSPAGIDSPLFIINTLASGDIVSCQLTSNAFCVVSPTALSNPYSVTVIPDAITGVSIAASANNICSDSTVTFTATPSNGGADPFYQWKINGLDAGADNPQYSSSGLRDGDLVSVVMTGSQTCSLPVASDNTITMTVYPLPFVQLTPDTIIAAGNRIRLNPGIGGDIATYQWSPAIGLDDPSVPNPVALPITSTTYSLLVVTKDGCEASAKETVNVFYDLLMPGAFTPNGDGKNDVFRVPPSVPVPIIDFVVYNRWGGRVFSTTSSDEGWDGTYNGKPQPAGVYVWQIEYLDLIIKKPVTKKGTVVLVR